MIRGRSPLSALAPLLAGAALLGACAPRAQAPLTPPPAAAPPLQIGPAAPQAVEVWEGSARVLLREQRYRLTFTVRPTDYALSGTLENVSSGDRFALSGTRLPVPGGAELTAQVTAGPSTRLNVNVLGVGLTGVGPKSDALLSGRVTGDLFQDSLRVNGVAYDLELRRVGEGSAGGP